MTDRLLVRSYRRVFRIDRRIYRVDRWVLPIPGGVPLRGVCYFAAALAVILLAETLPALGSAIAALSPPLRYAVLPLAVAVLGTQAAPDGRPAHSFAADWLRLQLRARRRSAGRTVPREREPLAWAGAVATVWDEHAPALRRAQICGPVRVTFAVPVELGHGRHALLAREGTGRSGDAVVIRGGEVLEVRP